MKKQRQTFSPPLSQIQLCYFILNFSTSSTLLPVQVTKERWGMDAVVQLPSHRTFCLLQLPFRLNHLFQFGVLCGLQRGTFFNSVSMVCRGISALVTEVPLPSPLIIVFSFLFLNLFLCFFSSFSPVQYFSLS